MSSSSVRHDSDRDARESLIDELRMRLRRGENPTAEEYRSRHPSADISFDDLITAVRHLSERGSVLPARIGPYYIRSELGRGAMGVVYEAHDPELDRVVAVKVLPGHLVTARSRERFRREIMSAARLEHPGIVRVYDSGEDGSQSYYTMQYIQGQSLDHWIAAARRCGETRHATVADWIAQAAEALHFAHERGVIHRDVKPSNLIVDDRSVVHLADFGLSKIVDAEDITCPDDLVGTLRYLAPERLTGVSTARSDVYSLGAVLYEALTLEPAARGRDKASIVHEIAEHLPIAPRRLDPTIPRDLETIVMTAMSPSPGGRYATAHDFAGDLRAFLTDVPIRARRPGVVRRLTLAARRNKWLTATLAVAITVLLAGAIGYVVRVRALLERTTSLALSRSAREALVRDPMLGLLLARESARTRCDADSLTTLQASLSALHEYALLDAHSGEVRGCRVIAGHIVSESADSLRRWSLDGEPHGVIASTEPIGPVAWSAGGDRVAYAIGPTIHLQGWTGNPPETATLRAPVDTVEFAFDGSLLAVTTDGLVSRWTPPGAPLPLVRAASAILSIAASPCTDAFAVMTEDGRVTCYDHDAQRLWTDTTNAALGSVGKWSGDGRHFAASQRNGVTVWSAVGRPIGRLEGHDDRVTDLAFSPDGERVLTGSVDQTARLWSLTGELLATLDRHGSGVQSVAFDPTGQSMLTTSADQSACLWTAEGRWLARFLGHDDSLSGGAFTDDGEAVVTSSADGTVRLWKCQPTDYTIYSGHTGGLYTAELSPDGRRLLTASRDGTARLWSVSGRLERELPHSAYLCAASFAPDGQSFWVTTSGRRAYHYTAEGDLLSTFESPARRVLCAWGESGEVHYLVRGKGEEGIVLASDGSVRCELHGHEDYIWSAVHDARTDTLWSTSEDGTARSWNARTGEPLLVLRAHDQLVRDVDVSASGSVVTCSDDGTARVWSKSGVELAALRGHTGPVLMATFSPDGEQIVTASRDGTARVWRADGKFLFALTGHRGVLWSAGFSPDGRRIVTASFDRTARSWIAREEDVLRAAEQRATRSFTSEERREYHDLLTH
ncbi:MAG: protein kinase [Planctomycetes bacterium]|nr:protein kinase [Planctomycetota bacterium]